MSEFCFAAFWANGNYVIWHLLTSAFSIGGSAGAIERVSWGGPAWPPGFYQGYRGGRVILRLWALRRCVKSMIQWRFGFCLFFE
jgi:hypothetical protein